jgi:S-adenosylmethionine-diacylgycerolhomoserine-N-methlytransferase
MPPSDNPHGALMDRVYGRQRHFYDLTRRYYLFGRDRLIRGLDLAPGSSAVEIGCGTARNLIAMATRYPDARLFGLDASQVMLETAKGAVDRAGLSHRITLVQAYAESLSPEVFGEPAKFDCAFFSYSLSMIPDWLRALTAANRALSPCGRLHIVDFGDFAGLGRIGRAAMLAWLARFHVKPRAEILQVLEGRGVDADHTLWVSPGRYAFVWSARRFPDPALADVADQPHAEGNP